MLKIRSSLLIPVLGVTVILIFVSGYLSVENFRLKKQLTQAQEEASKKSLSEKPTKKDSYELYHRCGDLPQKVYETVQMGNDQFSDLKGPFWAPDCRHIAWSFNNFFPGGWFGEITEEEKKQISKPREVNELDGVYLYDDRTQNIMKIYQPLQVDEYTTFKEWENKDTLIYTKKGKTFIYDIVSGTTKSSQE